MRDSVTTSMATGFRASMAKRQFPWPFRNRRTGRCLWITLWRSCPKGAGIGPLLWISRRTIRCRLWPQRSAEGGIPLLHDLSTGSSTGDNEDEMIASRVFHKLRHGASTRPPAIGVAESERHGTGRMSTFVAIRVSISGGTGFPCLLAHTLHRSAPPRYP